MMDRDWTGTAAAVTALALTAGVWLWPDSAARVGAEPGPTHAVADDRSAEDLARWKAEARRWSGADDAVQLSAASGGEPLAQVIR